MKQLLCGVAAVNAGVVSWSTAAPLAVSLPTTAITPSIRHSGGCSGDPSQSNGVNRMRFDLVVVVQQGSRGSKLSQLLTPLKVVNRAVLNRRKSLV